MELVKVVPSNPSWKGEDLDASFVRPDWIEIVKNIYNSPDLSPPLDLPLDFLCVPLRASTSYLSDKIENSSNFLKQLAWRIVYLVAIILFAPIACLGILLKSLCIPALFQHNKVAKISIDSLKVSMEYSEKMLTKTSHKISRKGYSLENGYVSTIVVGDRISSASFFAQIQNEIDRFSWKFRKIYLTTEALIANGSGTVTVSLNIFCPL